MKDFYPSRLKSQAEIIERIDPTVYSTHSDTDMLSKSQIDFYENNGYLICENLFTQKEISIFNEKVNELIYDSNIHSEVIIREINSEAIRSIFEIHKLSIVFNALTKEPRLTSIVNYLLGSETYIHQARVNIKSEFNGQDLFCHSDFETWNVEDGMPAMLIMGPYLYFRDHIKNLYAVLAKHLKRIT